MFMKENPDRKKNTMMEDESKRFANISIPFVILFIMKLVAQINVLF